MSNGNENNKPNTTPETIQAKIKGKIKETRLKGIEQKAKEIMETISKTEDLLKSQKAQLEELFEENSDLF